MSVTHKLVVVVVAAVLATAVGTAAGQATFFESPHTLDEMRDQQAVIETPSGNVVLDLLPERAPNHVAHFIETARAGEYDGTIFHFVLRHGIIQGGDPLTRDPAAGSRYGTGGLNRLRDEITDEPTTRGAVAAVQVPNRPDSAGSQFFICITDQEALQGRYTVFARVAEGMLIAQRISEVAVNDSNAPLERVVVTRVTIRERPPKLPEPFSTEAVEELAA